MESRWGEGVWGALAALGDRLAVLGPALLVAVTLVTLGLILGAILRASAKPAPASSRAGRPAAAPARRRHGP